MSVSRVLIKLQGFRFQARPKTIDLIVQSFTRGGQASFARVQHLLDPSIIRVFWGAQLPDFLRLLGIPESHSLSFEEALVRWTS